MSPLERSMRAPADPGISRAEPPAPADGSTCEHRAFTKECRAGAVFRVSRGRKYDAQDSCRRHLAATVEALEEGERRPVTVTRIRKESRDGS